MVIIIITAVICTQGKGQDTARYTGTTEGRCTVIITRAGEGTKIVFTGDIYQIDSPYLDEKSNGLSYIIDRLRGQKLFACVHLEKGERSELSDMANKLL